MGVCGGGWVCVCVCVYATLLGQNVPTRIVKPVFPMREKLLKIVNDVYLKVYLVKQVLCKA